MAAKIFEIYAISGGDEGLCKCYLCGVSRRSNMIKARIFDKFDPQDNDDEPEPPTKAQRIRMQPPCYRQVEVPLM